MELEEASSPPLEKYKRKVTSDCSVRLKKRLPTIANIAFDCTNLQADSLA